MTRRSLSALCLSLLMGVFLILSAALSESVLPDPPDDVIAEEESVDRVLQTGDTGEDVMALQTHLTELGYYTGEISGRYGAATSDAIRRFQEDFGLEATGVAGIPTQILLNATLYRPLKVGSSGEDVTRLQTRLTLLGYYTGKISGTFLDGTKNALIAFQSKMGIPATGEADARTQETLYSHEAVSKSGASLVTPHPEGGEEIVNGDPEEDDSTVPFTKKTSYGSSGKVVRQIQERLTELGYYTGPISSSFQGNTRNAVKAFQKQNALTVDGVVGEKTWFALFNDPDVALPGDKPRESAPGDPVPFHIVVDVTNQVVTVYSRDQKGEYTVVVREMICSTGTKKNPSDIGDFVLSGRKARWCYFPTWGDYAQYWTKINGSIAFHSVIYREVNTMSLSLKSYRMLGQRASHGCIRLQVYDAKWIYDNIPAGTVVTITDTLKADPELKASVAAPELNRSNMLPVSTPHPTSEPIYVSGAQPPLPLKKLGRNSSSQDVYWLQKKLTELGYYTGKCSGTYLDGTVQAVRAFQKDMGLSVTGTADVATLKKLYERELTPAVTPTPSPTPAPSPSPTPAPEAP